MKHYTVLKEESIANLNILEDGIYVDATLGYAGDSSEILKRIKKGHLFAFDRDSEACLYSQEKLSQIGDNFTIIHDKYVNMKERLQEYGITKVDGILFDLGVSSPQLDEKRGFSFMRDEDLDMRMNQEDKITAKDDDGNEVEKDNKPKDVSFKVTVNGEQITRNNETVKENETAKTVNVSGQGNIQIKITIDGATTSYTMDLDKTTTLSIP